MEAFRFINIGFGNTVNAGKIIAIVSPDSAPVKRLVSKAREDGRTVDATQGRKTKAVLIMENDRIILSALLPETIRGRAQGTREDMSREEEEKGTVVGRLLNDYDHYTLSVSMTTRKPREGEVHGVNYYFVSNEEFEEMISNGGLLEYAGYADHYYGTPRSFVEKNMAKGKDVILEIEVQGAMQIKKAFPDAVLIFITTPSAAVMAKRLIGRKTETEEQIDNRFKRAVEEAEHLAKYEYIVVNDDLEVCVREVNRIVDTGEGGVKFDPEFKKKFLRELLEIIEEREQAARDRVSGI